MKKYLLILLISINTYALQILDKNVADQNTDSVKISLQNINNLARAGDIKSQFILAGLYFSGDGVEKDDKLSFYWYKQVADDGYPNAQFNIANSYYTGTGIEKNIDKSVIWYEKAANQGLIPAMYNLAFILENDKKDIKKAFIWYEKAAKLGSSNSQLIVARKYQSGDGVKKDLEQAQDWFELALKNNGSNTNADVFYYFAEFLRENDNFNRALPMYKQAANNGSILANYKLSTIYLEGKLVKQDKKQAITFLTLAADSEHQVSQQLLASIYQMEKNYTKSIYWYGRAAKNGNLNAKYSLGVLNLKGLGVKKDIYKATAFFIQAAQEGHKDAQYSLAIRYLNGDGIEKNYYEAIKWLKRAAKQNHSNSQYSLSLRYKLGQGVEKDEEKRVFWLEKSANNNNKTAQYELSVIALFGTKTSLDEATALRSLRSLVKYKAFSNRVNYYLGVFFLNSNPTLAKEYLTLSSNGGLKLADKLLITLQKKITQNLDKNIKKQKIIVTKTSTIKTPLNKSSESISTINISELPEPKLKQKKPKAGKTSVESMYMLAIIHLNNSYSSQDYKSAFDLMKKTADLGFSVAQNDLALMYRNGMGVDKNLQEAYKLAYLAVKNGYLPANQTLIVIKNDINRLKKSQ